MPKSWGDCTRADLEAIAAEADAQEAAAAAEEAELRSLVRLMEQVPTAKTVGEALAAGPRETRGLR